MAVCNRFVASCSSTFVRSYSTFKTTKIIPFPKLRPWDSVEKEDKVAGKIQELVYNYQRAPLARVVYGLEKGYVVATKGMTPGKIIYSGTKAPIAEGNCLPLKSIPIGFQVSSVEADPGDGGKIARGCGNSATVLAQNAEDKKTTISLPSGDKKVLHSSCRAIIGVVGREIKKNEHIGSAGRAFHIYRHNKNWPRAHHKYRQRH